MADKIYNPVPVLKIKLPKIITTLFYSIRDEELAYRILKEELNIESNRYIVIKNIVDEEEEMDILLIYNVFFDQGKIVKIDNPSKWGIVGIFELDFNALINVEKMLWDNRKE